MIMKKSNVWKKTEWAGLICIFFILMILIRMLWNSGSDGEMADIRSVNSGWYQMVDGKEKALELPAMVKADQDGKIILYNNTLNPEDKNKVLSINGLQEQPEVWMGKKCLFRYEEKDFLKNDQMRGKMWADVWLTEDTGTEPFCLIYESNNRASLYIQAPVLGSFPAVTQKHFQESVFSFLMILGMWGTGIVSAIVFWYMKAHHIIEKRFLDASLFMFICGLWCYYSYVSSNALVCTEYNKRESTVGPAGVDIPSLWKCHFARNTQYPVSYPICAYAVFNTHYAVFRGYIHDLSSVERIQKK